MPAPRAIAFDVIETLFPLDPLRPLFPRIGLQESDLEPFFASLLRDAFALDTCGFFKPFAEVARSSLAQMGVAPDAAETILDGFTNLSAHPDVRPAFDRLAAEEVPVIALTNGNPDVTRTLMERNGLAELVSRVISIEEIGIWKPRAGVYTHAAEAAGVAPAEMALVACHPWDCQGAMSAGLTAGFVRRTRPYGSAMSAPQVTGESLPAVVADLLAL
ncbi:2-haloacid dehalogenase [Palleronia marisminoris]|uniref:2-haloalkanoic acid dehalogenase n=1 Tax=Palleronia marisminoris TaxID=315423 RepID=A0A1Y5TC87_9RHOB|nr:HAD family hydrolase [Palleronia marisminoris]SFH33534.1 2-haloacid dehalogenase [Palleronia marisminoris]SLN60463.1 2-haloalkanoic acid dehalogenase [Palleronia marisminoris]